MDRSSSETLSSTSSSSHSNRHRRNPHSKKRSTRADTFPYVPQSIPDVCPLLLSLSVHSYSPNFSQPWIAASNADPLKSLESRLLPYDSRSPSISYYSSTTYNFLPPVLHAGWAINEDALLQWCTSEGFDRTTYDIDDRPVFDYRSTVASALSYLAQRSGLSSFSSPHLGSSPPNRGSSPPDGADIVPYIQSTCNQKSPIIIALVSNYDIEGVMQLGSMKPRIYAFGRLLFREGLLLDANYDTSSSNPSVESPKWYLDYKEWQWVPIPKERLGSYGKNASAAPVDARLKVKVAIKTKVSSSALRSAYRAL